MNPGRRFFVIRIQTCERCEGSGRVLHPLWARLFRLHLVPKLPDMEKFFGTTDQHKWPKEWLTCMKCHGTGEEQVQVELTEALAEMGLLSPEELKAG